MISPGVDDDGLLPIAVLIDELRHDDVNLRKNAVGQ
jgi:hypothetical protein